MRLHRVHRRFDQLLERVGSLVMSGESGAVRLLAPELAASRA